MVFEAYLSQVYWSMRAWRAVKRGGQAAVDLVDHLGGLARLGRGVPVCDSEACARTVLAGLVYVAVQLLRRRLQAPDAHRLHRHGGDRRLMSAKALASWSLCWRHGWSTVRLCAVARWRRSAEMNHRQRSRCSTPPYV